MYADGRKWVLNSILFADDTVIIAENERLTKFGLFLSVCKKRKLKVNANRSRVMVCEWSRSEMDFVCPYRVGIECEK